jgi:hypothetical protein
VLTRLVSILAILVACDSGKPPAGSPFAGGSSAAPPAAAPVATPPPAIPSPAPAATGDPGFGDVAFKTYEAGGKRLVFTTDAKAKITWRNMTGSAVNGTYVKTGKDIAITWDPAADNYGSNSEKLRQMGPCSMARYERVDKKGALHDDDPVIYQQTKPRCDTVRLTQ